MSRAKGIAGLRGLTLTCLAAAVVVASVPLVAGAADKTATDENWLTAVSKEREDVVRQDAGQGLANKVAWGGLSLSVDFTYVTDYMWRGINFSEYKKEGREAANWQLGVGFEIDPAYLGAPGIGVFGGAFWWEWYADQEKADFSPWSSSNLQEVDYQVYWAYNWEEIGLGIEAGWIAYHFPRLRETAAPDASTGGSDGAYNHEVYVTLSYDDSKIFGQPILNPYFSYYLEIDDNNYSYMEFGVSHEFALKDWCGEMFLVKDMTVTPSAALGVDHRIYDKGGYSGSNQKGTKLAVLIYGVEVGLDLSSALAIPEEFGSWSVAGFINYQQSLHDRGENTNDNLWGGVTLSWGF